MKNTTLTLKGGLDRARAWSGGGSVRYLVAEVGTASAEASVHDKPLNLAIVIDASGSMDGPKLESAKLATIGVIESLGAQDRLSVVSFAEDVQIHLDGVACVDGQTDRAMEIVRALGTRGTTNLSGGWLTGAERVALAMAASPQRVNRVVLLSDGHANAGMTKLEELAEHAAQLRVRGIATSTVGIGDDYSSALLQTLAEHGGGQMHDAEHPHEIAQVLLGELRESQAVAAENAALTLETPPGTKSELVGFYPVLAGPGELTAVLGALGSGRSRPVVFRLTLPEGMPGSRVDLRLRAAAGQPGSEKPLLAQPVELSIEIVGGTENKGQARDVAHSVAAATAWHASVVRTIARLNRDGDRRQARSYLERELRFFQRYCTGLPQVESLVRELALALQNVEQAWSERTRKEMELSAFKTARSEANYRSSPRPNWSESMRLK